MMSTVEYSALKLREADTLSKETTLLTHCRLNELPHTIYWKILISTLDMSGYVD